MRLCIIAHHRHHRLAGHLPEYLSSIVQEACKRGWDVTLCSSSELCEYVESNQKEPAASLHLFPQKFAADWSRNARLSPLQAQMWGWITTIRSYWMVPAIRHCDHLLIIDGDHIAYAIGVLGLPLFRCRVSLIAFGTFNRTAAKDRAPGLPLRTRAALAVVRRFLGYRKLRAVITTNPSYEAARQNLPAELADKVHYVKEIEAQWRYPIALDQARTILNIAEHWCVVLCYGELTADRKGLPYLFAAVDHPAMRNVLILMVGVPNSSTEELMNSSEGRRLKANGQVREIYGYVSSEFERTSFSAADAVWLGYPKFRGPSGVLEIARGAGVPVIASAGSLIGETAEQLDLGPVVDVTDPEQTRSALAQCFQRLRRREALSVKSASCYGSDMENRDFGRRVCDVIGYLENRDLVKD